MNAHSMPRQCGAALLVAIFLMLVLLMLGVSAARSALNAEKAARGDRDRQVALQAAEAALGDAERDIEGGSEPASGRAAMFAYGSAEGFVDGCGGSGDKQGLCRRAAARGVPAWQRARLSERGTGDIRSVEYGRFTGAAMPYGRGTLPSRAPRYIIEQMPYVRSGEDASGRSANFYRITAIGFGANYATRVVLQSYYLKAAPAADAP